MHRSSRYSFERRLVSLKRRLMREATLAVDMLERSLQALREGDQELAREIRRTDDRLDLEEIEIEHEAYRILMLEQPVASDFRILAFVLRANGAIERVGDHATSVAKIVKKLEAHGPVDLPTPLGEMVERVPLMCHALIRSVLEEDVDAARQVMKDDDIIDDLDDQLFDEIARQIERDPAQAVRGLLLHRVSRELERTGDLMADIAEDLIYMITGEIVRHEKRRKTA